MDAVHSDTRARVRATHERGLESPLEPREVVGSDMHTRQDQGGTGLPTAAQLYVHSLPGLGVLAAHPTHPLTVHAGELPSYPGEGMGGGEGDVGKDAKIFFLKVNARRSAGKQRVVFWFNGGPGCSSFDGALMEVGPFRTVPASQTESGQVELKLVNGGWEEFATIVFVDQPPGTGLSYVPGNGYLHELDEASQHVVHFMKNFYSVFPELDGLDTYLAGESFAGQYIPYIADAMLRTPDLPNLVFKGVAIGNGWIDPLQQYPGYVDFGYEKGLIKHGTPEGDAADEALRKCQQTMSEYTDPLEIPINIWNCGGVMDTISDPYSTELNGKKVCLNVYDVRLVDEWPACGMNWPPDLPDVYEFLRRADVVQALHATIHESAWIECDNKVGSELHLQRSPASVHLIPGLIEAGLEVLMFAGAEDLICNYKGIERMIEHMTWSGELGWGNATAEDWTLNGTSVGQWQTARGMSYAKIYESSHMVGFDVPHVTNDMIMRFLGVDLSQLVGSTAVWSSGIGGEDRVAIHVGGEPTTPGLAIMKGGSTDWETYYNAFSAFFILAVLGALVGGYWYVRHRRLKLGAIGPAPSSIGRRRRDQEDEEERIPLGAEYEMDEAGGAENGARYGDGLGNGSRVGTPLTGKGKGKAKESNELPRHEVVFALGDEEER